MQNLKDSFYLALRDRLAALVPARVVTIQNLARPAVVVIANETPDQQPLQPNTFYLTFGAIEASGPAELSGAPLVRLGCKITYWVEGTDTLSYQDRGRALAGSDDELVAILSPRHAALKDYRQTPAVDLGSRIFWTRPLLRAPQVDGRKLTRVAELDIFACNEGGD